jgi:hypothetical protein
MGKNKPTYADTVEQAEQHLTDARAALMGALLYAELTEQERETLTALSMDLLDVAHKVIDAKHINTR